MRELKHGVKVNKCTCGSFSVKSNRYSDYCDLNKVTEMPVTKNDITDNPPEIIQGMYTDPKGRIWRSSDGIHWFME